jgi:hypothetical protein
MFRRLMEAAGFVILIFWVVGRPTRLARSILTSSDVASRAISPASRPLAPLAESIPFPQPYPTRGWPPQHDFDTRHCNVGLFCSDAFNARD